MKTEYQHFKMRNIAYGTLLHIVVGPLPIPMKKMESLIKVEFRKEGKRYGRNWIIEKAWVSTDIK